MFENITTIIITIVTIFSILLNFLQMLFSNKRNKGKQEILGEEEDKPNETKFEGIKKLFKEIIPQAIKNAEKVNRDGATKKVVALADIMKNCGLNNISFFENLNDIENTVETLIDLSKNVNNKKEEIIEEKSERKDII